MRFRNALITIALLLAAGMGLLFVCAVPTSPLDDPANFRLTLSTPQHADSIYYVGDTLGLLLKTDMNTTGRSLAVNISSLQHTYFDTTMALSGKDSIALKYALNEIADLKISAKATLSDKSTREVSTVVYVKGRSPQIVSQSDTAIVCTLGVRCSLWVVAQGTPPLRYQWYKGNLTTADTLAKYVINQAAFSDSGEYFCIVSNSWSPPDTSARIKLHIIDTTASGLNNAPVFWTQPFTMNIAKGTSKKSDVAIIAKDTIDHDSIKIQFDYGLSVLPLQATLALDAQNYLSVFIPQSAQPGSFYSAAIIASDKKNGYDTLLVNISVFDPAEADTIGPTITAELSNPINSAVVNDSIVYLNYIIEDFSRISKAGYVQTAWPSDTHYVGLIGQKMSFAVALQHGTNSIMVFAIDSSISRNSSSASINLIYNKKPMLFLISPENHATAISARSRFIWHALDPDKDSLQFSLFVGSDSNHLVLICQGFDTSFSNESLFMGGLGYAWKVKASDGFSNIESQVRDFTINNPPMIALTAPANNASGVQPPVVLSWHGTDNDTADRNKLKYNVYIGERGSALVNVSNWQDSTTFLCSVAYGVTYDWKIDVTDGKNIIESPTNSFSIKGVNASLSALDIQGGSDTLNPSFSPINMQYTYRVHFTISNVTITASTSDISALLKINGQLTNSGQGFRIQLPRDTTSATILVTGSDGSTQKTYQIKIIKINSNPHFISNPMQDTALLGRAYIDTLVASDFDSDPLVYHLVDGRYPNAMKIDTGSGILHWIPDTINKNYSVWVTASDGRAIDTLKFQIFSKPNAWICADLPSRENGMALIRAKDYCFLMGSYDGGSDEQPVHYVCFSYDFWMGQTEVTKQEYISVMGGLPPVTGTENLPFSNITWYDAIRYCIKKSQIAGLDNCYDTLNGWTCDFYKNGYRLPMEAEWEYACRGGTTTKYFTGDTLANGYARINSTAPSIVPASDPNRYDLFDMMGNVSEWCNDRDDITYYASSPHLDPPGSNLDQYYCRVVRGGGFKSDTTQIRSAARYGHGTENAYLDVGFRIVKT
jgi:formylglycine-generating enzyme required for sulfatase activity